MATDPKTRFIEQLATYIKTFKSLNTYAIQGKPNVATQSIIILSGGKPETYSSTKDKRFNLQFYCQAPTLKQCQDFAYSVRLEALLSPLVDYSASFTDKFIDAVGQDDITTPTRNEKGDYWTYFNIGYVIKLV